MQTLKTGIENKISMNPNREEFNSFFIIEYLTGRNENSVVARLRLRIDAQEILDMSLAPVINILSLIPSSVHLLLDLKAEIDFNDAL